MSDSEVRAVMLQALRLGVHRSGSTSSITARCDRFAARVSRATEDAYQEVEMWRSDKVWGARAMTAKLTFLLLQNLLARLHKRPAHDLRTALITRPDCSGPTSYCNGVCTIDRCCIARVIILLSKPRIRSHSKVPNMHIKLIY